MSKTILKKDVQGYFKPDELIMEVEVEVSEVENNNYPHNDIYLP